MLKFFSRSVNTHGQLRASHGSHMKAAHNVLDMKKHTRTYASYRAMDISCMTSRSVLYIGEAEGVRYILMHCGPAAYVLGPPPSRGGDLELEGGVIHATSRSTYTSHETPTCEVLSNGVVEISLLPSVMVTL